MTKQSIDRVENGDSVVISRKAYQWWVGILVTVIIALLVNTVAFGIWKGTIDERIKNIEITGTILSKENHEMLQNVVHNQKILMKSLGIQWETLQ